MLGGCVFDGRVMGRGPPGDLARGTGAGAIRRY